MRLAPVFVPVKRIKTPKISRSEFSDDIIEKLANAILELQGIVDPIILRRQGSDAYEIVEGVLEYYAAARAREIDLRKGEMISAFILEGEKEEALKEQVELLRKSRSVSPSVISPPISVVPKIEKFESQLLEYHTRLTQVESRFENSSKFESQLLEYHTRLTQVESRFEKHLTELERKYTDSLQEIKNLREESKITPVTPPSLSPIEALNTLNTLEQKDLESRLEISSKIAKAIIKAREKEQFQSLVDFKERVTGVGPKTFTKIRDRLLSE